MKSTSLFCLLSVAALMAAGSSLGEEVIVEVSKDNFARSNQKNRNNGASPQLLLIQGPSVRSFMAFDLSAVTNEIESAEFQFCQVNTIKERDALDMTIAPMVQTANNIAWGEGKGNLGIKGHPAQVGESSFTRSSFREVQWESASGDSLSTLLDSKLWAAPLEELKGVVWTENNWISVPVKASYLEKIRNSTVQEFTLGMWGTSGRGFYYIHSKESAYAPKLVLQLKEEPVEESDVTK